MPIETDVLVIGCGIAGAAAALRLAGDRHRQVLVVTRAADAAESNTYRCSCMSNQKVCDAESIWPLVQGVR
jgi:glycine/D-amino acid oxidase-like deaminating enzyme